MFIIMNESEQGFAYDNGYTLETGIEFSEHSDDYFNIMEGSMFFEEGISEIIKASATAEVMAYAEGTIETFQEGAWETIKEKIKKLWEKVKAFLKNVKDRFVLWVKKTFMSNESFLQKYKKEISENVEKLKKQNKKLTLTNLDNVEDTLECIDKSELLAAASLEEIYKILAQKKEKSELISDLEDFYNDVSEEIDEHFDDAKKDCKDEAMTPNDRTYSNALSKLKTNDYIKLVNNFEKEFQKAVKDSEKRVNDAEKAVNKLKDDDSNYLKEKGQLVSIKIEKKLLSSGLEFNIFVRKKFFKNLTTVAYAALKLKNKKTDDIKREGTALDNLERYLQRI